MSDSPLLSAALAYAARGWPVFPCAPRTGLDAKGKEIGPKRPLIPGGFHAATYDPEQIRAWWARWPDALIAVPTGPRTGWVLDLDRHPGGADGLQTLADLERQHGALPPTPMVRTASNGRHLWWAYPADRQVTSRAKVLPAIDVRGAGGYVIVPPSVSEAGPWEWSGGDDPADGVALATAPAWLLDLVCRPAGSADPAATPAPRAPGGAESFFAKVNSKALARLDAWVPPLFPGATRYRDGYRVTSKALGRDLQEDLSILPAGIQDFGEERGRSYGSRGLTPIDLVLEWGSPVDAKGAALWLCAQLSMEPAALGWREGAPRRPEPPPDLPPGVPSAPAPPQAPRAAAGADPGVPPSWLDLPHWPESVDDPEQPALPLPPGGGRDGPDDAGPRPPPGGGDDPDRPVIRIIDGHMPEAIDAAEDALLRRGGGIYQRGDQGLVRIAAYAGPPSAGVSLRVAGAVTITQVTQDWLADAMTRHITWLRYDARTGEWRRKDAPAKAATGLLARGGSWRFPYLSAFCTAPLLDLDGRLIAAPGYDAATGLYLVDPPAIADLGECDRYAAEAAADRLEELIGIGRGPEPERFPFAKECDASAAIASCMTALERAILPTAPICAVSASTPGTGKSLWVDTVTTVAVGRRATVVNMGKDPEETEKRIGAQLMLGESFSFDNIEGAFRSEALCTAATQEHISVRVLGQSAMARVPTRVQLWLTGNNVTPLGDLARRTMLMRLDAGCERPELRRFTTDAIARARENRAEIIRCCLIISRAYLDAGCPPVDVPPTGSFEAWDRMVRYPLVWIRRADPLGRAEDLREGDHSIQGLGLMMQAWYRLRPQPIAVAELYDLITETVRMMEGGTAPAHPDLYDAAVQIRGDPRKWGARDLGYILREAQDRPMGGLRITRGKKTERGVLWHVEPV